MCPEMHGEEASLVLPLAPPAGLPHLVPPSACGGSGQNWGVSAACRHQGLSG